ncbi:hypothetical protein F4821DRAFT_258719 [Hypoxylon rubiginosum]|uniref:Uncharacterized protein n=1 Tax=Hypoxylon rubiginosum TaxID=110542 RepID=A0ACC0D571_9PEZI|nr:hypothetical protein F4821DRAFT_258719 [Hypoxylon rubiginosum]
MPKSVAGALTARDMEILAIAWSCFDGNPKLDWNKLAELASFKNVQTARACFLPIKKKLMQVATVAKENGGDAGNSGEPDDADEKDHNKPVANNQQKRKQPLSPTPSPKKARLATDTDEEDKVQVKRPKRKAAARRKVVEKMESDEDDEYFDGEA